VSLQALRECDVVKVVEGVDGRTQTLIIFFLNQEIVQRLVDRFVVVVLQQLSPQVKTVLTTCFRGRVVNALGRHVQ